MFDLLGFDRFDLIQDILAYRQEICTAALSKMDPVFAEASSSTSSSSTSNDRKGNNYCVQVIIIFVYSIFNIYRIVWILQDKK